MRPTPLVWAVVVALAVVFAPTLAWLFVAFTDSIWKNGHGLFVPVVMAWLAVSVLRGDASETEESSAWGWPLVGLGLAAAVVDAGVRSGFLSLAGLLLVLPGLSLLLLGARRTRDLAFPLALGVFLIPLPTLLGQALGLPLATAAGMTPALVQAGFPVLREGTLLTLTSGTFGVSANCSGFSTLYAGVGVALVLAFASRSYRRAALLLLAVWPLTVLANVTRSSLLVAFCELRGIGFLDTPLHGISGIAAFWSVIAALVTLDFLLGRRRLERQVTA